MMYQKQQQKKKRKKHRESLLQNKESRICYLCARGGDYSWKRKITKNVSTCRALEYTRYMLIRDAQKRTK